MAEVAKVRAIGALARHPDAHAQVIATGVGAREWNAAQEYLYAERPTVLTLNDRFPHALAPGEAERLQLGRPRFYLPVRLASALLRRIKLSGNSWRIGVVGKGADSVDFSWDGDVTVEDALMALCHPVTQIAHGTCNAQAWRLENGHGWVNDLDAPNRLIRTSLLTGARALDVWSGLGNTQIHVEMDGGPPISALVDALRHPVAGVTAHAKVLDAAENRHAQMCDLLPTADRFLGDLRDARPGPALLLRTLCSQNEARNPRTKLNTVRSNRVRRADGPSSRTGAHGGDLR